MHTEQDLDVMSVAATDSLFETIPDVNLGAEENLPADPACQVGHLQLLHPWKER